MASSNCDKGSGAPIPREECAKIYPYHNCSGSLDYVKEVRPFPSLRTRSTLGLASLILLFAFSWVLYLARDSRLLSSTLNQSVGDGSLLSLPRLQDRFDGNMTRSNGTHEFKRTVLMVSIDGFRADYLDRGLTPHLLAISKKGIRARSMKPIFPTLTFPNHWTLLTGLYAESHGIIANDFWDPVSQEDFQSGRIESAWKPMWWQGEPVWETAEKAGILTANLMWLGPPHTASNVSSRYFVPWKNHVPLDEKLSQILNWIDLPFEDRPQLITVYEPSLDQAGHNSGPNSTRTNASLIAIDNFAKDLQFQIETRNLSNIVDILFVSDHGMADIDISHPIYLDDYIGTEGVRHLDHIDGWPALGLRFDEKLSERQVLQYVERLVTGAREAGTFDVLARSDHFASGVAETLPERWHFEHNVRIAPVWIVPKMGYMVTTKARGANGISRGNHGFDNSNLELQAMFVAHGPFSRQAKAKARALAVRRGRIGGLQYHGNMKPFQKLSGWDMALFQDSDEHAEYIMDPFANLEIYNLVIKLLGIDQMKGVTVAANNGTVDFWDVYL